MEVDCGVKRVLVGLGNCAVLRRPWSKICCVQLQGLGSSNRDYFRSNHCKWRYGVEEATIRFPDENEKPEGCQEEDGEDEDGEEWETRAIEIVDALEVEVEERQQTGTDRSNWLPSSQSIAPAGHFLGFGRQVEPAPALDCPKWPCTCTSWTKIR